MHLNVPPDALSGSPTLVCVLGCWLNDCNGQSYTGRILFVRLQQLDKPLILETMFEHQWGELSQTPHKYRS